MLVPVTFNVEHSSFEGLDVRSHSLIIQRTEYTTAKNKDDEKLNKLLQIFRQLSTLTLYDISITSFAPILGANISTLVFSNLAPLPDISLLDHHPTLMSLKIDRIKDFNPMSLAGLLVQELDISNCPDLPLEFFPYLPRLTSLTINFCGISSLFRGGEPCQPKDLKKLGAQVPNLVTLAIVGEHFLDPEAPSCFPSLNLLDISRCFNFKNPPSDYQRNLSKSELRKERTDIVETIERLNPTLLVVHVEPELDDGDIYAEDSFQPRESDQSDGSRKMACSDKCTSPEPVSGRVEDLRIPKTL